MLKLSKTRLKNILLRKDIIDEETFNSLYDEATRRKQDFEDLIISKGIVSEDYFYNIITDALGVERVKLENINIEQGILRLIPEDIARNKGIIVFNKEDDGSYDVAMENPTDLETINFLSLKLGGSINPYLIPGEDLNRGFAMYGQRQAQDFKQIIEEKVQESLRSQAKGAEEAATDVPIVALVDNLFAYAVSSRASDIHFEVLEDVLLVRFRIDGIMKEIIRMPKEIHSAIAARIKILSGLRIDEHQKPQDGRFRYDVGNKKIDVRISVIPTFYGEKVEGRILEAAQKPLSFDELGMFGDIADKIKDAVSKSYGMVAVCGPTGAGKTTTLYSVMNILNQPEVNIITVEDPIEYDMRYVNQMQVNRAAEVTFANGLRSVLRQDPDIIMVGEVRDGDTASIAVQSALTGHLVLSSLHTNDAPTAIPRLMDMGVKPFLVSAVLNAVSAQRLVRRVHKKCLESYEPDENVLKSIRDQLNTLGIDPDSVEMSKTFYRGRGCDGCNHTGYEGRIGIFEVLDITEKIRNFIIDPNFDLDGLRELAKKEGMKTMFEDGLGKVERGMTTIDEIFRVIRE